VNLPPGPFPLGSMGFRSRSEDLLQKSQLERTQHVRVVRARSDALTLTFAFSTDPPCRYVLGVSRWEARPNETCRDSCRYLRSLSSLLLRQ
jgi:hypothetical protein